jgi:hypothetical protein
MSHHFVTKGSSLIIPNIYTSISDETYKEIIFYPIVIKMFDFKLEPLVPKW